MSRGKEAAAAANRRASAAEEEATRLREQVKRQEREHAARVAELEAELRRQRAETRAEAGRLAGAAVAAAHEEVKRATEREAEAVAEFRRRAIDILREASAAGQFRATYRGWDQVGDALRCSWAEVWVTPGLPDNRAARRSDHHRFSKFATRAWDNTLATGGGGDLFSPVDGADGLGLGINPDDYPKDEEFRTLADFAAQAEQPTQHEQAAS